MSVVKLKADDLVKYTYYFLRKQTILEEGFVSVGNHCMMIFNVSKIIVNCGVIIKVGNIFGR